MRLIYIAGPYTAPTAAGRAANIQRAREVADRVNRLGAGRCLAMVPHFLGSGIEDSLSDEQWYPATMEVMRRCDAVVLTEKWEGSKGAGDERAEAERRGLPVFHEDDLRSNDAKYEPPFLRWLLSVEKKVS